MITAITANNTPPPKWDYFFRWPFGHLKWPPASKQGAGAMAGAFVGAGVKANAGAKEPPDLPRLAPHHGPPTHVAPHVASPPQRISAVAQSYADPLS